MTSIQTPQEPEDSRQVVRGIDGEGNLVFKQIGVEELNYFGRWGAIATSGTENTIAIGEHYFVLDDNSGDKFRVGDEVLCIAPDRDCFIWGSVIGKDEAGGVGGSPRLLVFADDISNARGTFADWELQVVGRPKFAITKDSSASSVDPTAAGPFTLTVTAGKFFPIGGKLLLVPIEAPTIALVGKVKAYSGTTLIVEKNSTNATVSTSYTSWAIALLDAPQDLLPKYAINGLKITQDATDPQNDIVVSAGSVLDYTGTINLPLSSALIKKLDAVFAAGTNQGAAVKSSNLAGTISSSGTAVTGTGTVFLTDFSDSSNLDDYDEQAFLWNPEFPTSTFSSIISSGAVTSVVTLVTNNTSLTTNANLSASAGSTYQRGGPIGSLTGASYQYGICIVRKDADGSIDIAATALTPTGVPDLPSGYTYYRVIGIVTVSASSVMTISQPLFGISSPNADFISRAPGGTGSGGNVEATLGFLETGVSPAASTVQAGFVELATNAETITGTDTARAVTPAGLQAKASSTTALGIVELATTAETQAGTSATLATTPAGVAGLSGTYTPTSGTNTNLDADPTVGGFEYLRVGDVVWVSGVCTANPTAGAGTTTSFRLTVPVASSFTAAGQAHGVAIQQSATTGGGHVEAVPSTQRVLVEWQAQTTANTQIYIMFTYRII